MPRDWTHAGRGASALAAVAVLTGVLLGACGGSSKTATSSPTTASSAAAPTSTTATTATTATTVLSAEAAADAAKAKQVNLQAGDFPAGWTSSPADPRPTDDPDEVKANACIGLPPPSQLHTADVDSDDFHNGESAVSSNVTMARTVDLAHQELAAFTSDRAIDCVRQLYNDTVTSGSQGATVSDISVTRIASPTGGDGGFAYRVTFTVAAQGHQEQVTSDMLAVLVGRAEVLLSTQAVAGQPVAPDLEQQLMAKMVARAKA